MPDGTNPATPALDELPSGAPAVKPFLVHQLERIERLVSAGDNQQAIAILRVGTYVHRTCRLSKDVF